MPLFLGIVAFFILHDEFPALTSVLFLPLESFVLNSLLFRLIRGAINNSIGT
jgi:hypothetical protein